VVEQERKNSDQRVE